jgi:hypothetical protein
MSVFEEGRFASRTLLFFALNRICKGEMNLWILEAAEQKKTF